MIKINAETKKRCFLKAITVFFIAVAALGLFALWFNFYSTHSQSYKESENIINKAIATHLNKKINELVSKDFEEIEEISLKLHKAINLKPLMKLKNLKSITFSFYSGCEVSFSNIAKLKQLKALEITVSVELIKANASTAGGGIYLPTKKQIIYNKLVSFINNLKRNRNEKKPFDPGQLAKIKRLEKLSLRPNDIKIINYRDFVGLENLEHLFMSYLKIRDIDFVSNMTNLKTIQLDNLKITRLDALASLENLRELKIKSVPIRDIKALGTLKNLETLEIPGLMIIKDISPLENMINLQNLDLSYSSVRNIEPLKNLVNLQIVNLQNTQVTENDIAELQKALPGLMIIK